MAANVVASNFVDGALFRVLITPAADTKIVAAAFTGAVDELLDKYGTPDEVPEVLRDFISRVANTAASVQADFAKYVDAVGQPEPASAE
jgi:hypothetical protein